MLTDVSSNALLLAQSLLFTQNIKYTMKPNSLSTNLALVSAVVCALLLAFSHNASATPHPLPPTISNVPDGDNNVAWGGSRRAWFGATVPEELTLRFLSL